MKNWRMAQSGGRALWRNPLRTFLMTIGIAIGIAALTVIVATGEAARDKMIGQMQAFGSDALMVMAGGSLQLGWSETTTTLTEADARAIQDEIPGIKTVSPAIMERSQSVIYQDRQASGMIVGATPEWSPAWQWPVRSGAFITDEDVAAMARVCVVGATIARDLFGEENPIGASIRINQAPFEVKGVLAARGASPGGGDMDNRLIVPLSTASRRLFNRTYLSNIRVQLRDPSQMETVATQIEDLLRERHGIAPPQPDDFSLRTPDFIARRIEQMSDTMSWFLVGVAAVSLLV